MFRVPLPCRLGVLCLVALLGVLFNAAPAAYADPPDQFSVSLPLTVSNGNPGAGAGNLETSSSSDVYEFTTGATHDLRFQPSSCPGYFGNQLAWQLVDTSDSSTVDSGSCSSKTITGVAAGTYDLVVTPAGGNTGTYGLSLFVVPPPDEFSVTLPLTASDGVPGTGAGNLETSVSKDIYEFTTLATRDIEVDPSSCPGYFGNQLNWALVDTSDDTTVDSGNCSNKLISAAPSGTYDLVVTPHDGNAGTYALHAFIIPPPDEFSVTLPLAASNGVPASGAGNLESTVSKDIYEFTTTSTEDLRVEPSSCPGYFGNLLDWKLVDTSNSSTVDSGTTNCTAKTISNVPAGTYDIVVTPAGGSTGTYNLSAFVVPPPDEFSVSLPFTASNGSPGTGAGNLETSVSIDTYSFTLSSSGAIDLNTSSCPGYFGNLLHWELVNLSTSSTVATGGCGDQVVSGLSAASYTLVVTPQSGVNGTYHLNVTSIVLLSLTTPANGASTQQYASLQAHLAGGAHAARFQFRTDPGNAWSTIPDSRLTTPSNGSVTQPLEPGSGGNTPTIRWDMPATASSDTGVGDNGIDDTDKSVEVRVVSLDINDNPLNTTAHTVTLDRQPPVPVTLTKPTTSTGTYLIGSNQNVTITPANAGEVAGYSIITDQDPSTIPAHTITDNAATTSVNVTADDAITQDVHVSVVDAAGNWSDPTTASLAFIPAVVHGQKGYSQGWDQRALGDAPSTPSTSVGPVNVSLVSGNALVTVPGPSFPGVAGKLGLSVSWNSAPTQPAPTSRCTKNKYAGCQPDRNYSSGVRYTAGLGAGFSLGLGDDGSYAAKLIDHSSLPADPPDPDPGVGAPAPDQPYFEVVGSDGSSEFFAKQADQNFWLPAKINDDPSAETPVTFDTTDGSRLVKNPSAAGTIADPTWTLSGQDGTVTTFGATNETGGSAQLGEAQTLEIQTQAKGNTSSSGSNLTRYQYTYTVVDGVRYVTGVDETNGPSTILRSLTLVWHAVNPTGCAAAIVCVTGPDAQTWHYAGDANSGTSGKLVRVSDGTRDVMAIGWDTHSRINSIRNADDLDPTNASAGYNADHTVTLTYKGTTNNAVASVTDSGVTQGGSTADNTYSFDYTRLDQTTGLNGCGAFSGSITPAHDHPAQAGMPAVTANEQLDGCYTWTQVTLPNGSGERWVVTDVEGHPRLSMNNDSSSIERTFYDHQGNLLWSEDADGNPTDYTYDRYSGRLLTVAQPDPDGAGPKTRPTTLTRYDEKTIGTPSTPGDPITGLRVDYFKNPNLAGTPEKQVSNTGSNVINETWGTSGPGEAGQGTNYSVRWSGILTDLSAGDGHFSITADDGVRVLVDDKPIITSWADSSSRTLSGTATSLPAGNHRLVVEYFHNTTGSSGISLSWQAPGAGSPSLLARSAVAPSYGLETSTVSPTGEISFSHYADPIQGQPDYTLQGSPSFTNITSFTYDSYGRLTSKVMPKGNTGKTINSDGVLSTSPSADPDYYTTYTYYDATGAGASEGPPAGCPSGSSVDQAQQLKSVAVAGVATKTFVYDAAGRTIAMGEDKGTRCSIYDSEGRLTSERTAGDATPTSGCPSLATYCYTYDPAGLMLSARNANGRISLSYDEAGRLVEQIQEDDSGTVFGDSKLTYDADGNRSSDETAAGSIGDATSYTRNYGHDQYDRFTGVGLDNGTYGFNGLSVSYDSRDNICALTNLGWGEAQYLNYNPDGWLTTSQTRHSTSGCSDPPPTDTSEAGPIVDYNYVYDQDGRITSQTRTGGSGLATLTTGYTYDDAGRLHAVDRPDGTLREYAYDADSNRTSIHETPTGGSPAAVASYTYDNTTTPGVDQLTSATTAAGTTNYGYSNDGEVTTYGDTTLGWDGNDRMSTAQIASSTNVNYAYDALGRVQSRTTTSPSSTIKYVYSSTDESDVMQLDASGEITSFSIDGPVGTYQRFHGAPTSDVSDYLYYDGHGSLAATGTGNHSSGLIWTYTTNDEFGKADQAQPSNTLDEAYVARWHKKTDTATGLTLMGDRPYDATLGRFLSIDPIDGGSANNYDYTNQDPVNNYDLTGTSSTNSAPIITQAKKKPKKKPPRHGPSGVPTGKKRPPKIPGRNHGGKGKGGWGRKPPPGWKPKPGEGGWPPPGLPPWRQ